MTDNRPLPKVSRQAVESKNGVAINLDGHIRIYDPCAMESLVIANGVVRGRNVIVPISHIVSIERVKNNETCCN